jgi:F-type H+-transporting ATPase subunit delta
MRAPDNGPQPFFTRRTSPATSSDEELSRVEQSTGITVSLAGRYASALYDLARERGQTATVEEDLARLDQAVRESGDLADLIRNPEIGRQAAGKAIAGVAGVLASSELTRNFLGVLAANRRLAKLPDVARAFAAIAAAARGEVTAQVTTAHPLDDAQRRELAAKLKAREGREVKLDPTVDPAILGGIVVKLGSQKVDASIRTKLNRLALAMKG